MSDRTAEQVAKMNAEHLAAALEAIPEWTVDLICQSPLKYKVLAMSIIADRDDLAAKVEELSAMLATSIKAGADAQRKLADAEAVLEAAEGVRWTVHNGRSQRLVDAVESYREKWGSR